MSRLKQRVQALEGGGEVLSYWDLMDLRDHEDDGHTIDWTAAQRAQDPRISKLLDAIEETAEEQEESRRQHEEHKRHAARERKLGLRSPGPVEPRLRRYVPTSA